MLSAVSKSSCLIAGSIFAIISSTDMEFSATAEFLPSSTLRFESNLGVDFFEVYFLCISVCFIVTFAVSDQFDPIVFGHDIAAQQVSESKSLSGSARFRGFLWIRSGSKARSV